MRCVLTGVLVAILPACARNDLSARCAAALVESAQAGKLDASSRGNRATVGGVEFTLNAQVEQEQQQGSTWVAGIAVTTSIGDSTRLSAGSIGVGTSRADAIETAISEWVQLAGVAIVRGAVLKERASERFTFDRSVVYPGVTGFRGPAPPPWSKDDHARLLTLLLPAIPGAGLHSISLSVVVDPAGAVQCDCRLDGVASPLMLDAVQEFPWPRLKTSYMFKQYYIAERTQ